MSSNRLRDMRENFHSELRKRTLEQTFRLKRLVTNPVKHYPIEQLIDIVDKLMRFEELNDEEFQIMVSILDDVQSTAINDPSQFCEWAEHLRIIKTLVDSMCLGSNPKYSVFATKAANCFRQLVKQKKSRVYVNQHFDQVCEIYKSWIDSDQSLLKENGLRGLNQLVELHSPKFSKYDIVESVLKSLQVNRNNDKALRILASITKSIDDDNQVIAILRIASKLIESADNNLKEKGLMIIENASRNLQNVQFILTMRIMQSIMNLINNKDKNISKLSLSILVSLSFTSEFDECSKLLDLGIMDVLYGLLKNTQRTYCRIYGSMIFNNLMASSHLILDQIVSNQKILETVFDLLETDVVDVRRELYQAFKNFLVVCTQNQLLIILDSGLLDYEISGLDDIDLKIVQLSIETLGLIIKELQSSQYKAQIYQYFSQTGVQKKLENLIQICGAEKICNLAEQCLKEYFDYEY
ncbi:unnamed protein product (macronuclear) [Paramecium tetraurelia]|uniref:Armadillo repeat-containing domain-containing protein n=1 Tax=Paramecium tetraurelia TaxID=5888 RepID=A0BX26_PARTE|nr:uncharacterized protein GSPATT00032945001 [Paramecium tetraurelia]CAK63093.1 unnamed protein product [Paramecium tetraurelia]|eukprot:XP_001430491.1 hypothetical protein (macronuclear) [Paramecium tetraurelia strain d4-2]